MDKLSTLIDLNCLVTVVKFLSCNLRRLYLSQFILPRYWGLDIPLNVF